MKLLVGKRYRDILEKSLVKQGFSAFWLEDDPDVDPRLAGHADLSVFRYRDIIICAKSVSFDENTYCELFGNRDVKKAARDQGPKYPADANLCALTGNGWLMHNEAVMDPVLRELTGELKFIHINQGYARCTALNLGDAVITADNGIISACRNNGIDVLQIAPGGIKLDGFDYGFIGGASFTANKTVYFTGRLTQDAQRIEAFIADRGCDTVYLTEMPIFDIGGAILL